MKVFIVKEICAPSIYPEYVCDSLEKAQNQQAKLMAINSTESTIQELEVQ
jgi:hypothetical protein